MAEQDQLRALVAEDERVRAELAASGELFEGYHPRMQAVHDRNATLLEAMIEARGGTWPCYPEAWLIAQHAIARPAFQRRVLTLLRSDDAVPRREIAMLEDRILCLEGREQIYGTQFDWDDNGEMGPLPIADLDGVDDRRAAVGLNPLAERIAEMRALFGREKCPADLAARRLEATAWARSVGWR
jgi:hypothetical protein